VIVNYIAWILFEVEIKRGSMNEWLHFAGDLCLNGWEMMHEANIPC
jgi:hypothetical protein